METTLIKMPGTPPRWVNRLMSAMLRTPGLRSVLGSGFALITVSGSVTGSSYTTPVQYMMVGNRFVVLSQRHRRWWRNIRANPAITLLVRGVAVPSLASIAEPDEARSLLTECLTQQPRLAKFYGIPSTGGIDPSSVDQLAERVVVIAADPVERPVQA